MILLSVISVTFKYHEASIVMLSSINDALDSHVVWSEKSDLITYQ